MKKELKKTHIIGSKTLVDFPLYDVFRVPAKVDTGADSSSVWASEVKEFNNQLSFTLFGEGSAFYTGQQVVTKQYKIRSIKNSFGRAEFRYKVRLSVAIESRKLKVWFTLANRGDNRYPILIGRRTLASKFVVDVSQSAGPKVKKVPKVLVLVNSGGPTIRKFYAQLNQEADKKFETKIEKYKDIVCSIDINKLSCQVRGAAGEIAVNEFDVVYFKTSSKNAQLAASVAAYVKSFGGLYFDQSVSAQPAQSKLLQYARLAQVGVNVPDTTYMHINKLDHAYLNLIAKYGKRFVLKDNFGRKGRNRFAVKTNKDFALAIKTAKENKVELLAQQYIDHDYFYRFLVLGKRVEFVIKKESRMNMKAGAKSKNLAVPVSKIPTDLVMMAVKAADTLGLQVAGVDIAQDKKTGKWYCFEVNSSPQLVAGAFVDKKRSVFARFLNNQVRN